MQLLPPMRFRPCADDQAQYGGGWTVYDESALTRLPARELVEIEQQIGMSLLAMLRRHRDGYVDGALAATWVARRLSGVDEPYADYQPLVLLMDWEPLPAGDVDPPAQTSSTSPSEG